MADKVINGRPADPLDVKAAVFIKIAVLDGYGSFLSVLINLVTWYWYAFDGIIILP
jgi:hypothetical protein